MNLLDVGVILLCGFAALGGYRLGFITRSVSWIGMGLGIFVAARVLPSVIRAFEGTNQIQLFAIAASTLVLGAFVGQAIGLLAGSRLRVRLPQGPVRSVDRGAGAAAGLAGVAVSLWLILPTMANTPGWPADQARNSVLSEVVSETFPPAPDALQALRRLVGENDFPQVFAALSPAPDIGTPPGASGLSDATINQVMPSTFKISGTACDRIQEGTGFAAGGPGLVITNAHVVSGQDRTDVQLNDGSVLEGTVVAFDPDRDLAVLRVPGLASPALPIGDVSVGGTGGVFGHPGGGPLRIAPFEVGDRVNARGYDIYDQQRTEREVLVLASQLRSGDSGSALVNDAGQVVGVAFAVAPDDPNVAYALTTGELNEVLAGDLSGEVDTGPCL